MNTLFSWALALALVIGLGSVPTLTYADQHEKDPIEEAEEGGEESGEEKDAE